MGQVLLVLDPAGGVAEVRLLPGADTRFDDAALFRFTGRLGPVVQALDETLLLNPLLPPEPGTLKGVPPSGPKSEEPDAHERQDEQGAGARDYYERRHGIPGSERAR